MLNMNKLGADGNNSTAIEDYLRVRYISAPEAAWRIFGFDISHQRPSVAWLAVHIPDHNLPKY
jgi:hypothetical protein